MFNRLYEKSLKLASHKSSKFFLAIVSFAESSFFPIPPDIMVIPMVIARKKDYLKIFLIASISSALGGILGYFIGSFFLDFAMNLIDFYGYENHVINLKNNLSSGNNFFLFLGTLFLAGFTPLPFKVFTITSGMIGFNILIFFFVCLLSRGIRFFVVSYLTFKFGDNLNKLIKNNEPKLFIVIFMIIVIFLLTTYFLTK
jgi:membrane protein YqaA with SNARE-associated domain